jgi:hypothetical protein
MLQTRRLVPIVNESPLSRLVADIRVAKQSPTDHTLKCFLINASDCFDLIT